MSISLALYLAIMQTAWYRTGKPKYLKMVKFWSKPFLTADRATVLITHRLSALELVDEIIVLKNGGVAERGRHGRLVVAGGLYTQAWESEHASTGGGRPESAGPLMWSLTSIY